MSDIFGKIKSGASKAAKEAEKAARIQRIEIDISGLKRKIEDHYKNLGEVLYNAHINGETEKPDASVIVTTITDLKKQITAKEEEIKALKEETTATESTNQATPPEASSTPIPGKRFCTNCGKENDVNAKFCAECGTKMS